MHKEHRKVYDYYKDGTFFFRIGYVHHPEAHWPMPFHEHGDMTEFVYLKRGSQNYQTAEKLYTIHQGEVFFTLPHEFHNTGTFPEEVSVLYYLIIDLSLLPQLNVFIFSDEYQEMNQFFQKIHDRIYKASSSLGDTLHHLMQECLKENAPHFHTRIRNALSEVLIALSTPLQSHMSNNNYRVQRSLQYIQTHLCDSIRISDLCKMENLSLSAFNRQFTEITGIPPGEYVLKAKIEKVKELLVSTDLSITEIAYEYGFSSSQYFATVFKRFCSVTPSQYRRIKKAGQVSAEAGD